MILYFKDKFETIFAVDSSIELNEIDLKKLEWLFVAKHINKSSINSNFIGPKKTMISPWSTNAVEISENMAISGILRCIGRQKEERERSAATICTTLVWHVLWQRFIRILLGLADGGAGLIRQCGLLA